MIRFVMSLLVSPTRRTCQAGALHTTFESQPRAKKFLSSSKLGALLLLLVASTSLLRAQTPGSPLPITDYNAADTTQATTNGQTLGPGQYFGQIAWEAERRQAVILVGQGKFVSFTLTAPANAVTIHYAIPDAAQGNGMTQPLSLYVNNTFSTSLSLTSALSWVYGAYPYSKTPTIGTDRTQAPHDFYNDVRFMFSSTLPAGTVVKLQVDAGDNAPWYVINTADFEVVPPPIAQPANSINVTQAPISADNTGSNDVTAALQNAVTTAAGTGQIVYLPAGTYKTSSRITLNNVTIEGAGDWYTVLNGSNVGFTGNINPASTNVNLSNLAIFDNATLRNDSTDADTGINGGFSNSTISNLWIQNEKAGMFLLGPATSLTLNGLRIMDLKADGINFWAQTGAITNSTIENSYIRNSQDDSIAMFAEPFGDTGITINQNTVISPGLANAIAVYGSGSGDVVSNNLLMDPVQAGSCIHDGLRFGSVVNTGILTIKGNTLQRCGVFDPNLFFGFGSIWFYPDQGNIAATENLSSNVIQNSPYSAYMFLGPNSTTGVSVSNDTLTNIGTFVVHTQGGGSASIANTSATGVGAGGFLNLGCSNAFALTATADTGWSAMPASCNQPATNPLWVYPDVQTFQTTQGAAVTQKVVIYNASYQATTLGAITASPGFSVSTDSTNPCGATLAAAQNGGSSEPGFCFVDVTFAASAAGLTTGTLTIPSNAPGGTSTVLLVGSTGGNTVVQLPTVSPSSLTFGNVPVGNTSTAQTVTLSNPAGAAPLSVSISVSAGYAETNTCGTSLLASSSCTISVTFTPTSATTNTGSLTIANSGSGPITVAVTGNGTSAPSAPSALSAASAGAQAIALSWTGSLGSAPITYNIFRGTVSHAEGTTAIATSVASTSFVDTTVTAGTTYFYTVSATNPVATSAVSNEASASALSAVVQIDAGSTAASGTFSTDTDFNTGSTASTTNSINTADVVNPAPAAVYQTVRFAPAFTYTIPGLSAGATYTVRLHFSELTFGGSGQRDFNVAINGTAVLANFDIFAAGGIDTAVTRQFSAVASTAGNIVISFTQGAADNPEVAGIEVLTGSSASTAPSVPTNLIASSASSTVTLNWSASTGSAPVTYNVYRGTTSGGEGATPIATGIPATSFTDNTVTNGTTYFYDVAATNSVGTSAHSVQASATPQVTGTAPTTPTAVTAAAGNSTVALSWTASTGSTPITYNVFRGTTTGGESATAVATGITATNFTDTGLANGTEFFYVVSAMNSIGSSAKSAEVSATPTNATAALVQINAGGSATAPFAADTDFNNGNIATSTSAINTAGVANAAPAAVYQSVRWAPAFSYVIPGLAPGASYNVRLHFVELTFAGSGQRVFNVAINGTSVLSNFDVFAAAGAQNKALVENFTATADALGQITVSFTRGSANNPDVAALEVLGSGALGHVPADVLAIDTGSSTAVSTFTADEDFNTGNVASSSTTINTSSVAAAALAAVYQTVRWAPSFTYTIPGLTAGTTYAVRLHFAELTFTTSGSREFNVAINGASVLNNFDIVATSGSQNQAITQQFNAVANASGQIVIAFTAGAADNPQINAIEILH
jgi:fibronectin type 3 domain-containing protein